MGPVWVIVLSALVCQASVMATTILLHRALTHGGLRLNQGLRVLMHLHLSLFTGIKPREWVAVHRKHHHFSDGEGDPHSPIIHGLWRVLFGNVYYYRREAANEATLQKYTPDYQPDLIDRLPSWLVGGAPVIGIWLFGSLFGWMAGVIAFVVQGAVYILLSSSINSVCHVAGYRNFSNQATNVWLIALLTGGEGLHNNHHEYPSSARFAVKAWEVDPAWPVIRALEYLRLAQVNKSSVAKAG